MSIWTHPIVVVGVILVAEFLMGFFVFEFPKHPQSVVKNSVTATRQRREAK